jgi:hypothetical protein
MRLTLIFSCFNHKGHEGTQRFLSLLLLGGRFVLQYLSFLIAQTDAKAFTTEDTEEHRGF